MPLILIISLLQEFYTQNTELNFSRIPILNDNKIESYVLKDTILESIINDKGHFKLAEIKRPIITSSERTRIPKLFDKLLKKREHIFFHLENLLNFFQIILLKQQF